jgi:hypothetical protein
MEQSEVTGKIEDINFSSFKKVNKEGEEVPGRIARIVIEGISYTTFNEEIMDAFHVGDEVLIDYSVTIKGDKKYLNIKDIMLVSAVKKNKEEKAQLKKEINSYNNTYVTTEKLSVFVKNIVSQLDGLSDISSINEVKEVKVEFPIEQAKVIITIGKK